MTPYYIAHYIIASNFIDRQNDAKCKPKASTSQKPLILKEILGKMTI